MKTILATLLASTLLLACTGLDPDAEVDVDVEREPGTDDAPAGDSIESSLVGCWTFVQSTDTVHEEDSVELGADRRFNHIWSISAHAPDLDGSQHEPQVQTEETSGTWTASGNIINLTTDDGIHDQVEFELVEGAIIVEGRTYLGTDC